MIRTVANKESSCEFCKRDTYVFYTDEKYGEEFCYLCAYINSKISLDEWYEDQLDNMNQDGGYAHL